MADEVKWAYLAGILDGEGSMSITHRGDRSSNSYEYIIQVYSTDLVLINWVQGYFGGRIYADERNRHPGERWGHKPINRIGWHSKEDIAYILEGVIPYLVIKKDLAQALHNFVITPMAEKEMRELAFVNTKLFSRTGQNHSMEVN